MTNMPLQALVKGGSMRINLWSGILMVLVSLTLIIVLIPLGIDEPKKVRFAALAPSYYPYIVSTILLLLGAVIIIRSRREKATQSEPNIHPQAFRRLSKFILLLAVFAASLEWAGFILSSSAALIVALILAGERRALIIIANALIIPIILYLFFYKIAGIPIPLGFTAPLFQGI